VGVDHLSRRDWLRRASLYSLGVPFALHGLPFDLSFPRDLGHGASVQGLKLPTQLFRSDPTRYRLTPADEAFLEEIERASFDFFWEQASPMTGQIDDRGPANGGEHKKVSSVASTGFGLTAMCIADHRGWLKLGAILDRVKTILRFALDKLPHEHGFFYHFVNPDTGARVWNCEVSDIDTCLFLCGALTCRAHFDDGEVRTLATKIYERMDWAWMLNGGKTLAMGWTPEHGFLAARWDSYCELMMMYLLGMASPTHPLPKESWLAWKRPDFEYQGVHYVGSHAPLFVHQYSHAWFDFRGKRDTFCDYFRNSVIATKVHKLWCISLAKRFPDYSENLWGITASDSAHGYTAWGGPPEMGQIDGSIVPCAAGGSLAFLPEETLAVLRNIREKYGARAWKRYSFVDAFNPLSDWTDTDVIGIDLGITLLMAENARTQFVWKTFMKDAAAQAGMELAGFKPE
jgi:hypothetical protein